MQYNTNDKSAFIAIVGKPNVGKSSILNRLLGQKIAIVSSKPQTTRNRITGVLTDGEYQIVFFDTPGMHKPKNTLGKYMVRSVNESVGGVDCCMLVVEAGKEPTPADLSLIEKFKSIGMPANFAELGAKEEDIPQLVETLCCGDGRNGSISGFVTLDKEDCTKIYKMMV